MSSELLIHFHRRWILWIENAFKDMQEKRCFHVYSGSCRFAYFSEQSLLRVWCHEVLLENIWLDKKNQKCVVQDIFSQKRLRLNLPILCLKVCTVFVKRKNFGTYYFVIITSLTDRSVVGGSRGLMVRESGLVIQRLRVRLSGPAGIVGGESECTALSPPSIPLLRCPWARHRTPNFSPGAAE